ncbi:hypothetical protein F511_28483 [Dorcoceras hygrometricum]|uniref:Uncharacterized protein n=1 Tax=Dorcoceras hygrometricum TaxID=472368 RepID=A0A2Z7ACN4_9LAMI|nr:hypothetical protein F511_28483 [Dorcoceras hygrometricum]
MSPSVLSVVGVGTSSFGLIGTTAFGLAEKTQLKLCRDTLVTVHRTLSSSIANGRQLRLKCAKTSPFCSLLAYRPSLLGCEICVSRTQFVVIVAQRLEGAVGCERVTPVPHLPGGTVSHRERSG